MIDEGLLLLLAASPRQKGEAEPEPSVLVYQGNVTINVGKQPSSKKSILKISGFCVYLTCRIKCFPNPWRINFECIFFFKDFTEFGKN